MLIFVQMATKRTKLQKIAAAAKRVSSVKGPDFYTPAVKLPMSQMQKDLLRTIIITFLILIILGALYYWLERGGWKILTQVWQYGR